MQSKHPLQDSLEKLLGKEKVNNAIQWAQKTSLPGFARIPLYDILVFLYNESRREKIIHKVNSLAFSFLLALFPFFLFLFTLIPILPIKGVKSVFLKEIEPFIPDAVRPFLFKTIDDVVSIPHNGLLSISFIMALYFSTNAMQAMMLGFEKSYDETFKRRNFWQKRLDALKLVFLVAILVLTSVAIIIFGNEIWGSLVSYFTSKKWVITNPVYGEENNWVIQFLFLEKYSAFVIGIFKWLIVVLLFQGIFATIFRYGPSMKKRLRFFSPGTTLATASSIIISLIFSTLINNFGSFHLIYGPIGALIIILLYIQLNCFVIVACFELNASIAVNRDIKKVMAD
ncbi:MAG: YihY/virulence factor BrkB family protein [Saprospiraceae bacterium]|jgi:membrane protein|nr:YihY/virulence factor BrkB family protein [Saprospiraceae bacterium]MBK8281233.1 YihY/virulence factor BrkB family protein [Saprospiraceae bacterium]MBK8777060.1 YihY/virulence factor BrkB family protein [Saprospiraceae bacterium]MBK9929125.1 YihY/virulence factor BrkB family protein [Saprospiraceae bacterium]